MLIAHTYYTAGMHELAKVFTESFCYHHINDPIPLIVEAVGVTPAMVSDIEGRYPFCSVNPISLNLQGMANQCNVPVKKLKEWKRQIEQGYVTPEAKAWKLMTAGDHRVQMVYDKVKNFPSKSVLRKEEHILLHFDIDTLFRKQIHAIKKEMKGYDVGLKLRPTINPVKARITIDFMALRMSSPTLQWLVDWTTIINNTKPMERPIGFGQSSCWQAYEIAVKQYGLKALTLPLKYGLPGRNKADNVLWCGNVHKLRKANCVDVFREEFKKQKSTVTRGI